MGGGISTRSQFPVHWVSKENLAQWCKSNLFLKHRYCGQYDERFAFQTLDQKILERCEQHGDAVGNHVFFFINLGSGGVKPRPPPMLLALILTLNPQLVLPLDFLLAQWVVGARSIEIDDISRGRRL
jgi:hypothetical protein